jgi:hypothetical protein
MRLTYAEVYDEIVKYYPLGIKDTDPRYVEYPGINLLQELSFKKNEQEPYKKWKTLIKSIKDENSKVLKATHESPLFDPSYSGKLLLSRKKESQDIYTREIHFHLSVIAPFYTVYGLDKVESSAGKYESELYEPIVYFSPSDIYEKWFPLIRNKIEHVYSNYQLMPFELLKIRVPSITVSGAKRQFGEDTSVFQALFVHGDITSYKFKADVSYE